MINITNRIARRQWQSEMSRQMAVLEQPYIRKLTPLLNRQFRDASKYVEQGMTDSTDFAVDARKSEQTKLLMEHYKRVATTFGKKAFGIIEKSKFIFPSEKKTPLNEYWKELDSWAKTQAATKITRIQKTTKKNIASVIQAGMKEGESHRDIAKRIRKSSAFINPYRSRTIALTETHTAAVKSVNAAVASTRIEMEREWVSAKDMRTRRPGLKGGFDHWSADGEKTSQDGKYIKTGQALKYPGDPSGSPGNIIRCLTHYSTPIYTSEGWKRVKDIVIGDLVLTHRNRFKKVLRLNKGKYDGEVVTIETNCGKKITVTSEHSFFIDDEKIIEAKNICKGNIVRCCVDSFFQYESIVRSVSKRRVKREIDTYNFAVEDDESYIAKGFVTHNCRCVELFHAVNKMEELKPYVPEEGFLPAGNLQEAEEIARKLKAPIIPKTSDEAFNVYSNNYEKYYSDDPLKEQHLKGWKERLVGVEDIEDEKFLALQNAINANYNNPAYRKIIDQLEQDDIIILIKKKIGNEGGLSRGNVSFIFDGDHLMKDLDMVIPGQDLIGPKALLRHEKAHFIFDEILPNKKRKEWFEIYKSRSKDFWQDELTYYSGTNSMEGFAELFTLTTDSTYSTNSWRFKKLIKDQGKYFEKLLGKRKLPGVVKPKVEGVLGRITPGKPAKSAKEILEHYEASSKATFIEGKSASKLKEGIEKKLGNKLFALKSKEMDDFIRPLSNRIATEIMEEGDYRAATANLIRQWAGTSGDSNSQSIMMQLAAKVEFKLEGTNIWWEPKVLKEAEELFKVHEKSARKFLRLMYEDTQEHLKKLGLKSVRGVRGFKGDIGTEISSSTIEKIMIKTKLQLQPMSSFSSNFDTARVFAERAKKGEIENLFFVEVPIKRILSTPVTGYGCMAEEEFVILGSQFVAEDVSFVSSVVSSDVEDAKDFWKLFKLHPQSAFANQKFKERITAVIFEKTK